MNSFHVAIASLLIANITACTSVTPEPDLHLVIIEEPSPHLGAVACDTEPTPHCIKQ